MKKYKVGDRVRVVCDIGSFARVGDIGTIVSVERTGMFEYGVRLDKGSIHYHDCSRKTDRNHGQWMNERNIELVQEGESVNHEFKVIITSQGDNTKAKLLRGKIVYREVEVSRYYKDEYSEAAAIAAVMDKLLPSVMQKEQPKKYFTGKVVCIEDDFNPAQTLKPHFRKGCIYEIHDGELVGERLVRVREIDSVESLNAFSKHYKFIEIKD